MNFSFFYPIVTGLALGTLNYLYWRKQGYTSFTFFFLGSVAFIALSVMIFKMFQ